MKRSNPCGATALDIDLHCKVKPCTHKFKLDHVRTNNPTRQPRICRTSFLETFEHNTQRNHDKGILDT